MVTQLAASKNFCAIPVVKSPKDYQAFRINPPPSNRIAIVFDSAIAGNSLTICIEIFDPGGKTPLHRHSMAIEMFYILKGQAVAVCDGKEVQLQAGDSIFVPQTGIHELGNAGAERLYVLCFMIPNENFAEMIRSGLPAELDEEDWQVLGRLETEKPQKAGRY
ncbi:MAG: cupin domain-containing protein [Chloroflexaceae bacterium]|nr:cupin domain-containing protein [Chloroflexaceae bacterium]